MSAALESDLAVPTLADVLRDLGDVPPHRVLWRPTPGTATEADQLRFIARGRPVELLDGVLVEKAMGYRESLMAATILAYLVGYVRPRNLGVVAGADAIMRLRDGRNRLPDVSFTAWASLPSDDAHRQAVADFGPDLAVEVLSDGNTAAEIDRKRREYFASGARLVWIVDIDARTVAAYTDPETFDLLGETDSLLGGEALPGFSLPLSELFNDPQQNDRPAQYGG
jgi:Uma2 family endonuclease